jgi:hypothetical protein
VGGLVSVQSYAEHAFARGTFAFSRRSPTAWAWRSRTLISSTRSSAYYKQSEQRAAELAVINRIQQGIAAKLDFQGIVELVGDKLLECVRHRRPRDSWWDKEADDALAVRLMSTASACRSRPRSCPRRASPDVLLSRTAQVRNAW